MFYIESHVKIFLLFLSKKYILYHGQHVPSIFVFKTKVFKNDNYSCCVCECQGKERKEREKETNIHGRERLCV